MPDFAQFQCVVLAGERPGGSTLANSFGVAAGVLVPVCGRAALSYVLEALGASDSVSNGVVCGPARSIVEGNDTLRVRLEGDQFPWIAPAQGPAASALQAVDHLNQLPTLITAGDHALLTPAIIDQFCLDVSTQDCDMAVGLVPYELVRREYPDSRRTVLRFSDGSYCGSNLFAVLKSRGRRALRYWSALEADRKKPWRMARRLGLYTAIRYLLGRLTLAQAFAIVSQKMNCRVNPIMVQQARAAVDVDSAADQRLAESILSGREPVYAGIEN